LETVVHDWKLGEEHMVLNWQISVQALRLVKTELFRLMSVLWRNFRKSLCVLLQ